jgi:hypothetical protein
LLIDDESFMPRVVPQAAMEQQGIRTDIDR